MSMLGAAQKSPEAFRTISEVAAELDVPQHVLRFWETNATFDLLEQAMLLHHRAVQIHPFENGNGRWSRYSNPEFDAVILSAAVEEAASELIALMADAQRD